MEFAPEVTARLENKPGRLAKICSALAHEKIDIRALAVMDAGDRSVLRLVTDRADEVRRVLTGLGVESKTDNVLAVEMDNRTGALARVIERLAEEHINVEYAYVSTAGPGRALGIFHTDNPKKAQQVLAAQAASGSNGGNQAGRRPLHVR